MEFNTSETELCSQKIQIFVNGQKVALAQECNVKTTRDSKIVGAHGEGQAYGVAVGAKHYVLTLIKIERVNEELDFATLSDFSVALKKQGKMHNFAHCEWTELCEEIINGKSVIQKAVISSPTLNITEV